MKKKTIFERHPKKTLLCIWLVLFIFIELVLRVLASQDILKLYKYNTTFANVFFNNSNIYYGKWHFANVKVRRTFSCYDLVYESNSYGARDKERSLKSNQKRIVVLGDSFIEGVGSDANNRLTELLEKETNLEHLNFGVRSTSTIHQWILYQKLAKQFDHTEVYLFLFPANDFEENDFIPTGDAPYLRKKENNFELFYAHDTNKIQTYKQHTTSLHMIIINIITNNIYTLNLLRNTKAKIIKTDSIYKSLVKDVLKKIGASKRAYYDNFTEKQFEKLTYIFQQIGKEAEGKKLRVFVIPTHRDLLEFDKKGYNFELITRLKQFDQENKNIFVYDLLPDFVEYAKKHKKSYKGFYLKCDGHWNILGNKVASESVLKSLLVNKL